MRTDEDSRKPPDKGTGIIKCPKCGHEFKYAPGWIKVSTTVGCPKCSAVIPVRKEQPE